MSLSIKTCIRRTPCIKRTLQLSPRVSAEYRFYCIHYISQKSNAKNFSRITGYKVKIRSQVQTITRAILRRNQSPNESNSQRGWSCEQIFDSWTTFLNPLVGTNSLYGKRTVGFFFSRLTRPYGRVRLACFARLRPLRLSLPFFFLLILRTKPTVLQSKVVLAKKTKI